MTASPRTSRRRLLGAGVCVAAEAVVPRSATAALDPALRLVDALDHRSSAEAVGRIVLESDPGATVPSLVAELTLATGRSLDALMELDRDALRDVLRDAREADFRAVRIVRVDGWILARTEARLAALAVLV